MKVLVLAPHPDDETIGCGGTLCLHARAGHRIDIVYLTSGELGLKQYSKEEAWRLREAEAREAGRVLGVAEMTFLRLPDWGVADQAKAAAILIGEWLKRHTPDRIYLPHPQDAHPDHQAVWPILNQVFSPGAVEAPPLWGYEVWSPMASYQEVKDISPVWRHKLKALKCHASQLGDAFDYERAMRGLNQYRGVTAARCRYAEVFQSLSLEG